MPPRALPGRHRSPQAKAGGEAVAERNQADLPRLGAAHAEQPCDRKDGEEPGEGLDRQGWFPISGKVADSRPHDSPRSEYGSPDVAEPVIACEDLHIRLGSGAGEVHVLKGISLTVAAGESLSLVGPSGSGKSTLMMAMAGLERADAGRITVAGEELGRLDEDALARLRGRAIGIVFQSSTSSRT